MYYCIRHDGKEYYLSTKEHFEDYLREVCGEEAFEAYNDLVIGEIENLKEELDNTKRLALSYNCRNNSWIYITTVCEKVTDWSKQSM